MAKLDSNTMKEINSVKAYQCPSFGHNIFATVCAAALCLIGLSSGHAAEQPRFIIVGTAGVTGVYYPIGGAVCRLMNRNRKEHGVRCSVESTRGSVANLNTLGDGELDFALVQSDTHYHAYNGDDVFTDSGPNKNLRSVFALYAEPFTVVARADSGINTFDDLLGKRVNIGNTGSGHRETMEALLRAKGWVKSDFALASELASAEQSKALCDNKIDAFVFAVGHPAGSLKEAANTCDVIFVSVTGLEVDELVKKNNFFDKAVVPGGIYRGIDKDVPTFGVSASLTASTTTSDEVVYLLVKSVFENLEVMKKMHPAFSSLNTKSMAKKNPDIPTHKGALRYFKEAGLKD